MQLVHNCFYFLQRSRIMASYQREPSDSMGIASAEPIKRPNAGLLTFRKMAINKGQITEVEEKRMKSTIQTQDNILDSEIYSEQFYNAARNVKGEIFMRF